MVENESSTLLKTLQVCLCSLFYIIRVYKFLIICCGEYTYLSNTTEDRCSKYND